MAHAPGIVIKGYEIKKELNRGAFANAYLAEGAGGQVFLKEYKSPKPSVDWYSGYVAYQLEIKRRIDTTILKNFVSGMIEFFEATDPPRNTPATRKYYQAHEFVTGGADLAKIVTEIRSGGTHDWKRRLTFAKVMMASIARLHEQKIVHCDLKPENIILIPDASIGAGYRLKLIDLDFSLLADRKAPWDGRQGYVQTPGWGSPEHMRGEVPVPASDVFTCGLILYDLLAEGNPYDGLDPERYSEKVLNRAAMQPRLEGAMPAGNDAEVVQTIHRCLAPKAGDRPLASDVNKVLIGGVALPPPPLPPPPPPPPPPPAGLTLSTAAKKYSFNLSTKLNQTLLRDLGTDAKVWDPVCQVTVERRPDGWYAVPNPAAANETLVNGKAIANAKRLVDGDVLAVGREAKGIVRTPLEVKLG